MPFESVCVVLAVREDVVGGSCIISNRHSRTFWIHCTPIRSELLVACVDDGVISWIHEDNAQMLVEI